MTAMLISAVVENGFGSLNPIDLRCEFLVDPIGIDAVKPRLSWKLQAADPKARALSQSSYRILVASGPQLLKKDYGDLWDSGKVSSADTDLVEFRGGNLPSRQNCYWKVQAWDQNGRPSAWSKTAKWSMGLLDPSDWHAEWIGFTAEHRPKPVDANREHRQKEWVQDTPSPIFRRTFKAEPKLKSAVATICGLGFYELRLNGKKVGDHELDPPFTRYDKRCLYATYDVTRQVKDGDNALGVMLGNGWFDVIENEEWNFLTAPWREAPRFILNLHLVYIDGTAEDVVSDDSWKAADGPVLRDAIRNGEVYDARQETPGWDAPRFDDSAWKPAEAVSQPKGSLHALAMPPVRVTRTIEAAKITEPKPGAYVFDFGQDMAGRGLLHLQAKAGTEIKIRYATQAKSRPPHFIVFCSRPEAVPEAYVRYLVNDIRERFGLAGIPIRLNLRAGSENPYHDKNAR